MSSNDSEDLEKLLCSSSGLKRNETIWIIISAQFGACVSDGMWEHQNQNALLILEEIM